MDRRQVLMAGIGALTGFSLANAGGGNRIPLIHCSDLYHPPQDPDDHIDLATVAALDEYDLLGVVCDVTTRFLREMKSGGEIRREAGLVPIAQLSHLIGRKIPASVGPPDPLRAPADDCRDRSPDHQRGIEFFLDLLNGSGTPVVVSVVGSARVLTAAFNRSPILVKKKVRSVLLNAGSTGGSKREWNVGLDPAAYVGLWRSGLPIWWFPCATERGAFNPEDEHGTYWAATHATLFGNLSPGMRAWFHYALSGDTRKGAIDLLHEEGEPGVWELLLRERRNLWSTASLVMGAGRALCRTSAGWRFIPARDAGASSAWPWQCDPIAARITDDAGVEWTPAPKEGNALLFRRRSGREYGEGMAEALSALLATLPG